MSFNDWFNNELPKSPQQQSKKKKDESKQQKKEDSVADKNDSDDERKVKRRCGVNPEQEDDDEAKYGPYGTEVEVEQGPCTTLYKLKCRKQDETAKPGIPKYEPYNPNTRPNKGGRGGGNM